jgi:uncharacterized protein (TIGR02217 family)
MAITVYTDVILPSGVLAGGVRGKQIRSNARTGARNGGMQINVNWARTLRQYELGVSPMTVEQWQAIEGLHEVTEGGAFGFLMPDPKDASASLANGRVSLVSGTTYQLQKRYTSAGSTRTKDRKITRPIAAGFVLQASGVTVAGADYTLNTVTGRLTIPSAPAAATLTWSGSFYVPVHFASDEIDWELVRSGPMDTRLMAGPSVTVMEVAE